MNPMTNSKFHSSENCPGQCICMKVSLKWIQAAFRGFICLSELLYSNRDWLSADIPVLQIVSCNVI